MQLALTTGTRPQVLIDFIPKNGTQIVIYRSWIFSFRIVQVKYQGQQDIPEFLMANLNITFDLDWSSIIFSSRTFHSIFIKQVINLRKVRDENSQSRTGPTGLHDPVETCHGHPLLYGVIQRNIFSSHIFRLMLMEQVINLRKVRTVNLNLKIRTDLRD